MPPSISPYRKMLMKRNRIALLIMALSFLLASLASLWLVIPVLRVYVMMAVLFIACPLVAQMVRLLNAVPMNLDKGNAAYFWLAGLSMALFLAEMVFTSIGMSLLPWLLLELSRLVAMP
jgi:hypothetical protein